MQAVLSPLLLATSTFAGCPIPPKKEGIVRFPVTLEKESSGHHGIFIRIFAPQGRLGLFRLGSDGHLKHDLRQFSQKRPLKHGMDAIRINKNNITSIWSAA